MRIHFTTLDTPQAAPGNPNRGAVGRLRLALDTTAVGIGRLRGSTGLWGHAGPMVTRATCAPALHDLRRPATIWVTPEDYPAHTVEVSTMALDKRQSRGGVGAAAHARSTRVSHAPLVSGSESKVTSAAAVERSGDLSDIVRAIRSGTLSGVRLA